MTKDEFQEIIDNLPGEFPIDNNSLIITNGTIGQYSLSIQLSKSYPKDKGVIYCVIPLGAVDKVKELYGHINENASIYFDSWYRGDNFYSLNTISTRSLKVISDCIDALLKDPNHHIYTFQFKKGRREYVEVG